jgi:hypothetical protein
MSVPQPPTQGGGREDSAGHLRDAILRRPPTDVITLEADNFRAPDVSCRRLGRPGRASG